MVNKGLQQAKPDNTHDKSCKENLNKCISKARVSTVFYLTMTIERLR